MHRSLTTLIGLLLPLVMLMPARPAVAAPPDGVPPRAALPDDTSRIYDVTMAGLLGEMTDLMRLIRPPRIPYVARLASSRDPGSDYGNWFANNDRGHFLGSDSIGGRREYVMMESRRPGAILRIWSANPRGTIRIYIDGAEAPVIAAPMADLLSGAFPPFTPPFAYVANGGYSFFVPISYARSCRVTTDEPAELFYCLAYREYPEGTLVEPYSPAGLQAADALLRDARSRLNDPSRLIGRNTSMIRQLKQVAASPPCDGRWVVAAPEGGGVIREIRLSPLPRSGPVGDVTIAITADTIASVEGPLRAFFGGSAGAGAYTTLPAELQEDGTMVSRWPMPFRDSLAIELRSPGGAFAASVAVIIERAPFDPATGWYFHASWHSEAAIPARPMRDWPVIDLAGEGAYVGTVLTVANPINHWWGEGDEKIAIDGREKRNYWGTGSEDLFGGAWGLAEHFSRPYHSFVEAGQRGQGLGSWYGFWTMNRWYLLDPLYFRERLQHDLEIYHTYGRANLSVGAMNFWYARAGTREIEPVASRQEVTMPSLPDADSIAGAIEGESMSLLYFAGTFVDLWPYAPEQGVGWSRAHYFRWKSAPGVAASRIQLGFRAPSGGSYRVFGYFASGPNFGRFDVEINDEIAAEGLDFAGARMERTGPIDLGLFLLDSSENVLTARVPGYALYREGLLFGLDAILLMPVLSDAGARDEGPELPTWLDDRRLRIRMSAAGSVAIDVVDAAGRSVVHSGPERYDAGSHIIDLGELRLAPGNYILRLRIGDGVTSIPYIRLR